MARGKQDNPNMPPAEPATSVLTPESQSSPELEMKFLTCLVSPARAGWGCAKDTGFLGVGHSGCGAPNDVAVEGDLEGVAVGGVVQEPSEEATACACLHSIPVEGCAGL